MEVKKLRSWIKYLKDLKDRIVKDHKDLKDLKDRIVKDNKYCINKLKLKQTTNNKQQTTNNKQQKKKIMNKQTLFYLLPEDVLPSILKHLNKETRTIMLCLIYYGDKIDLWNKWYPVTIKA